MKISIIIFLIISCGIIVYSNSLGSDFIWDDTGFVTGNDFIRSLKYLPLYFTSKETLSWGLLSGENYRPFLPLSFAIDYFFWGLNPFGYHITNTLLHIANAVLLFLLILRITRNKNISLFTSLLFLTHPVQTESVAWISGRADVLFLFFYLSSLTAYRVYIEKNKIIFYFLSLIFFAASLLSKEMAATLPFILILFYVFYEKKSKISRLALRYFPFFLILELYVLARFIVIGRFSQCGYWMNSAYYTFLTMLKGVAYYIQLLIYPANLCGDYMKFKMSVSFMTPPVLSSFALIALLIFWAFKYAKKHKHLSFSIFWFFLTLLPAINIIPIKILIAERFLYLPSIGYCFLLSALLAGGEGGFSKKLSMAKKTGLITASLLVFCYSYLTMARNLDWADEVRFWKKNLDCYPDNERAYYNLSVAYINRERDMEKAYEEALKSIGVNKFYACPFMIAASYCVSKNRYDDAIRELKVMLKKDPYYLQAHTFIGNIYTFQGKYDMAYKEYKKALYKNPDYFEAKLCIAELYSAKGDAQSAINEYKNILSGDPSRNHYRAHYAGGYLRLGDLYSSQHDKENAFKAWNKVFTDFKDQAWFYKISEYLTNKITLGQLLDEIAAWQPELQIIGYYFVGVKKEKEGDPEGAKEYYIKCLDTECSGLKSSKILARKRLIEIETKKKK